MRTYSTLLLASALAATPAVSQLFSPVDTSFASTTHRVPPAPLKSAILFKGYVDSATNKDGVKGLAKDWQDFTGYIPINNRSDSGYVIVNNEMLTKDPIHGDGGGMTVFNAYMKDGDWKVADHQKGRFRSVDFHGVGGTIANCGGMQTPWGTVLTAEEWMQGSNAEIHDSGRGYQDTSDFVVKQFNGDTLTKSIKRYENLNWMVEVDVVNAKAVKKHYNMGRLDHEGGFCMPDKKTVYITDDATPAIFAKFVSEVEGNYDKGKLYAYKQSVDGTEGSWLELPMSLDSMLLTREIALKRGATTFTRLEWADFVDGKLYIAETGRDASKAHAQAAVKWGSTIAKHLRERTGPDSNIVDYFGRVLRFDPATNKMDVLLEGGPGTVNPAIHLSNPDGLTSVKMNGNSYLVIQEDLNGRTQGRVPAAAATAGNTVCELYFLDLSIASPKVDDLKRLVVGPIGAEITGARFTPDGKTMFVNLQHPNSKNPAPYNTSYTLAVWGYDQPTGLFDSPRFSGKDKEIEVHVNAVSRFAYFSRKVNAELFDSSGKRLERHKAVTVMDIQHLKPGSYFLRFAGKQVHKLLLK